MATHHKMTLFHTIENNDFEMLNFFVENGENVNNCDMDHQYSPLHYACKFGNIKIIQYLVENGAELDTIDKYGRTPLCFAAENGHINIVKYLLKLGAQIRFDGFLYMDTPIPWAARNGHLEIVKLLVEQEKLDVKTPDRYHKYIIHYAAQSGNTDLVKFIGNQNINVEVYDENSRTPLFFAASTGNLEVVKYLDGLGANLSYIDKHHMNPIFFAVKHLKVVEYLCDNGVNFLQLDVRHRNCLFPAAIRGSLEVIRYLVEEKKVPCTTSGRYGDTPLLLAVTNGRFDVVEYLLERGAIYQLNEPAPLGLDFVCVAALEGGYFDIVKLLVQNGADIDAKYYGKTCLYQSVEREKTETVQKLIENGASTHMLFGADNHSLLHLAIQKKNYNIVQLLIVMNSDVNILNKKGYSPLHYAVLEGQFNILKLLREKGAEVNTETYFSNRTPLIDAAALGELNMIKYLIDNNADMNATDSEGYSTLHKAVSIDRLDIVKFFGDYNANVNTFTTPVERTPLLDAVGNGNIEMAKYLLGKGAYINAMDDKGYTALHEAAKANNADFVLYLIRYGANVNLAGGYNKGTVLHHAAEKGKLQIVKQLIENNADITALTYDNYTALHRAVLATKLKTTKYLVENGADVNTIGDPKRRSVLIDAVVSGDLNIFNIILEFGADVTTADKEGYTALHKAVLNNQLEKTRLLIGKGANINCRGGPNGETPIHIAAKMGKIIVKLLFENGADLNSRGNDGNTPLHTAVLHGKVMIVQYLVEKGVNVNIEGGREHKPAIYYAAKNGNYVLRKFLVDNGADDKQWGKTYMEILVHAVNREKLDINYYDNTTGYTALHWAVIRNDSMMFMDEVNERDESSLKSVIKLVRMGAKLDGIDNEGYTPLHRAVLMEKMRTAQYLLENGAQITREGGPSRKTILHDAAKVLFEKLDFVKSLVEKGADVNAVDIDGITPIQESVKAGHLNIAKYLLQNGAEVRQQDEFFVFEAVKKNDRDFLETVLKRSVNINSQDEMGCTPLLLVVTYGPFELVPILLEMGADINLPDESGNTPLHIAAQSTDINDYMYTLSRLSLVELLIKNNATIDARNEFGNSPLHQSLSSHKPGRYTLEIVEDLILKGANVNMKTGSRYDLENDVYKVNAMRAVNLTPLHYAVLQNDTRIVQYLVDKGADMLAEDSLGETPIMLAKRKNLVKFDLKLNVPQKFVHTVNSFIGSDHHILKKISFVNDIKSITSTTESLSLN